MLVTLDVFSGRPNPTWYVPGGEVPEFAELCRALEWPRAAQPVTRLGFRGLTVQQTEPGELPSPAPTYMRVAAPETAPGRDELASARLLLSTARAAVDDDVATLVNDNIEDLERAADAGHGPESGLDLDHDGDVDSDDDLVAALATPACRERLTPMVLPFWSTPYVQPYNNCYNYATNFVSGTLAQPGRRSGQIYASFSCDHVIPAARRDGLFLHCEGVVGVVALGIWPGYDFHWWRLHPAGFWAHKIGWSPPQTVDNSNRVIGNGLTPANCDRGPYAQFCGYFFVPPWMWVA
jgi:hypothetical protein